MNEPTTHLVYLHTEIPRFGSGWRKLTVNQIGPTWVHLQYGRKRARLRRSEWVELLTSTAKHEHRQVTSGSKK